MTPALLEDPKVDVAPLAQPLNFAFAGKQAKNRFFKAAMAENLANWDENDRTTSGIPGQDLINLYKRWGEGGWGTILTGNIQIQYHMPGSPGDMMIDPSSPLEGSRFEGFQALAKAAKANGSLIIGQISHVGRKTSFNLVKEAISASAMSMDTSSGPERKFPPVRAATQDDIVQLIRGFAHAAEYLDKAGFDGVELHAAHGYLLAQFLSGATNKRTDEYGGSLRNRMRLLIEIGKEIRRRTSPGFIIGAKLNSVEFQEDGVNPEEAQELCCVLQNKIRFDFVELSGGNVEGLASLSPKESTRKREAFFLDFAETIVPAMVDPSTGKRKTKVVLTGGLRSAGGMVKALEVVDAIAMGRPATQEPSAPADLLSGKADSMPRPASPFDVDIKLGVVASMAQMRQICKGEQPFDLTDEEVAARFMESLNAKGK
ncbi:NADH oxidase [Penicillium riverlandense]|uniref:NADH oxidase n=1 Tax=Penicillium riverlandense TaxID=1903569 RepID=UPI0025476BAF|nr:NADH oxidase [Penicillium riverlandense]KAJ5812670.1 NADH oxidase [Penicillium riverlandense]